MKLEEAGMGRQFSRRSLLRDIAIGGLAIGTMELGGLRAARAEDKFIVASTGGSWGEGIRASFITAPKLEERFKIPIQQAEQIESVAVSKILAQPNNPPFSVSQHGDPEAILLADSGCLQGYDPSLVTHFKDLYPSATQPTRDGMEAWFGSLVLTFWGLTYNTKYVTSTPSSFDEMWNPKYKGRVGVPAFGWYGMLFLHEINRLHGGKEDDASKGIAAIAELVRNNQAVILANADQTVQAFQREEVVIAPFFNGRTFGLQESGVPVNIAYVPCSTLLNAGYVIMKATEQHELANAFVDATFTPEFQLLMTKRFRYPPSNRKAVLPPEMQHYAVREQDLANAIALDWVAMNKTRASNLDRWNKEVLGS